MHAASELLKSFIGTVITMNRNLHTELFLPLDRELLESRTVSMSAMYSVFSAMPDTKMVHNSCLLNEYKLDLNQKFLVISTSL